MRCWALFHSPILDSQKVPSSLNDRNSKITNCSLLFCQENTYSKVGQLVNERKRTGRSCTLRKISMPCRPLHRNELFVLLSPSRQFLRLICRENQPNKCTLREMQCDGQYCLTEMENSFVGQVICRNCGFSLRFLPPPSWSPPFLSFSLPYLLPLTASLFFLSPQELDRGAASRASKIWSW